MANEIKELWKARETLKLRGLTTAQYEELIKLPDEILLILSEYIQQGKDAQMAATSW